MRLGVIIFAIIALTGCKKMIGTGTGIGIGRSRPSSWPAVAQLGTIINEDYSTIANLNNYTQTHVTATWAISGGKLVSINSGASAFTDYIVYNGYGTTLLDRWTMYVNFQVPTVDVNALGIAIGTFSTNIHGNDNIEVFAECNTGNTGQMTLYSDKVSKSNNLTGFSIANNDYLRVTLQRNYGVFTATFAKYTDSTYSTISVSKSCSYTCDYTSISNPTVTASKFGFYNIGGTLNISKFNVSSTAQKNVDYCFLGYSITEGFSGGGINNAWPAVAMASVPNKTYTKLCSESAYSQTFLDAIAEIKSINAKTYIMAGILGNDKALSIADATADANYNSVVSQIKAAIPGVKVIHCKDTPRNSTDLTSTVARVAVDAGTDQVIDLFTPLLGSGSSLNASYSADGTHLNKAGHAAVGAIVAPYL